MEVLKDENYFPPARLYQGMSFYEQHANNYDNTSMHYSAILTDNFQMKKMIYFLFLLKT